MSDAALDSAKRRCGAGAAGISPRPWLDASLAMRSICRFSRRCRAASAMPALLGEAESDGTMASRRGRFPEPEVLFPMALVPTISEPTSNIRSGTRLGFVCYMRGITPTNWWNLSAFVGGSKS